MPRYVYIKNTLRDRIVEGVYRPMDKIPSESELMDQFEVSRITVNRSLNDLENEGLIFRLHGKGSFVSKPKPTQDLSQLQGLGEAMAPLGFEIFNRVLKVKQIVAPSDVASALGLAKKELVFEIDRIRMLNRAPVSVDQFYIGQKLGARLVREDLATRDLFAILENDCGVELGHAEVQIEATLPTREQLEHLDMHPGVPCLKIERTTFTGDNAPLTFDRVFCRADRFRYQIRASRNKPRASGHTR